MTAEPSSQSWSTRRLPTFCDDAFDLHGATVGLEAARNNVPPLPFGGEQHASLLARKERAQARSIDQRQARSAHLTPRGLRLLKIA